eukprot:CAMPEP_0206249224 /NCGR_PEP_ID=MMETSP0047_2-20121206/20795_1 /ASSEMBLY_ACC=CAM_ASM_000192 /TAXON_ID=195065 /ORGANISM="Chroomonas mesostigmatica_cf, Strain CCMP1168" /LENGTH=89 /DNA_ID=CAMNT_0053674933 /DNA_START=20 /DNA_END=289 /DNA_ORIENTATION=-
MAAPAAAAAAVLDSDDDDFEEFETDEWAETKKVDASLWDEGWDTDEVDPVFAAALKKELEAAEAMRASGANGEGGTPPLSTKSEPAAAE